MDDFELDSILINLY